MCRKKILFVASASFWGGATVALYNLISVLKNQFEIRVVVPHSGVLCDKLTAIDVKFYIIPYSLTIWPMNKRRVCKIPIKTILRNFIAKKKIGKILDEYMPDIVHTNVGPLDLALGECQKRSIPHVWHIREYQDLDFNIRIFPSKKRFLNRIQQKGNYNVAITRAIFEYWLLRKNTDVVIYDGVINEDNQINTDVGYDNYFLFVGRIEPAKGLLVVLKAFAQHVKIFSSSLLLVAGSTKSSPEYYEECRLFINENNMMNNVVFLGERKDVYGLMSKAKALIVASRFEGFGFITAEAMYNECLVIGKNTAGTKEQFDVCKEYTGRDIGLRFMDENDLRDVLTLVEQKNFDEEKKMGKIVVEQNYTINTSANEIISYYEQIWSLGKQNASIIQNN